MPAPAVKAATAASVRPGETCISAAGAAPSHRLAAVIWSMSKMTASARMNQANRIFVLSPNPSTKHPAISHLPRPVRHQYSNRHNAAILHTAIKELTCTPCRT